MKYMNYLILKLLVINIFLSYYDDGSLAACTKRIRVGNFIHDLKVDRIIRQEL